jgi:hypothetical protein
MYSALYTTLSMLALMASLPRIERSKADYSVLQYFSTLLVVIEENCIKMSNSAKHFFVIQVHVPQWY